MVIFKSLNKAKATKIIQQVLTFTNTFPLNNDIHNPDSLLIDNYHNFLNVIHYKITKDNSFNVTGSFGTNNNREKIDIIDKADIFINKIFNELKFHFSPLSFSQLINTSNSFLKINNGSLWHKTIIIDAENSLLKEPIERFLEEGDEVTIEEFINLRQKFTLDSIYSYEETFKGDNHFNQDKSVLYNILNRYIGYKINFHLHKNQIFQIYHLLKEEFDSYVDEKIKKIFLNCLIGINIQFLIEPKSNLLEVLEDSGLYEEELVIPKMLLESNPAGVNVSNFKMSQGAITQDIVKENKIITIIRFSIPFAVKSQKIEVIQLTENVKIEYKGLKNKFSDPVYRMYKGLIIGGMPWNYFSDTVNSIQDELSTIAFIIDDFYHPDFEFSEKGIIDVDFSEKEALIGREYYPHKEFIIQNFLENCENILNIFSIEKKDITIDLFSSYIVDYFNLNTNSIVHRKLFTITNPDSFEKASNKFIERLNELNLSDYFIPIKELVDNTIIESDRVLSLFMQRLIEIVIKANIELHSNYKYFWKTDSEGRKTPQREPDMQPFISSQLRTICDYMGIQISREVESANGAIDFHCSYTYNGKLLKTCIELKNAHSSHYELGLTKQLPQYLKSERTRSGIYVLLWYKGPDFSEPKQYDSPEKLKSYLVGKRPKGFKTDILIIDCSKPIVPSKLK